MKRTVILSLLAVISCAMRAQLLINGHTAPYDCKTNTWLATVPEAMFGRDNALAVSLEEGWQQVTINGQQTHGEYTFEQIKAESTYAATVTDAEGHTVSGNIQFTFLPVVQLQGEFGNDYQKAKVVVADPDITVDSILDARVKWRGGTTNAEDKHKRNYNIKFDADVRLFGLRNDNNWMLDAGQPDVFRMRNRIAMDIWNDMATKPYYADLEPKALNGVRGRMVEVFLNDEYRGIYNFSEKMDRKQLKLKKVGKDNDVHGILYKGTSWGYTSMNDSIYRWDNKSNTLFHYEMSYPEAGDDNDSTDWKPLADAINKVLILCYDDAAFEQEIEEWFDIPVMIDYSVYLSAINALDNSGKNMFWAIYDKDITKKLTPAPWDLDCTFGQRWGGTLSQGDPSHDSPEYFADVTVAVFYNFYRTNALQFNDRLNQRYQELRQPGGVLSTESLIKRFTTYYEMVRQSGAGGREEALWSGDSDVWGDVIDFDKEYAYICDWITRHMEAVDEKGLPVYYDYHHFHPDTGIALSRDKKSVSRHIYNLNGQRFDNSASLSPGIYIINGQKTFISGGWRN